ncbi:MAG: stage sporulation protein [Thermomicrobiales bacterium]|nr:stage sporulation protein [Thermomicrobiales bacterium]
MGWSFRVLRVRGIDIRVHATFALILVWAAYYWWSRVDEGGRGALFGIVATLLLFGCVTLHELGHALTAQRYGIRVEDITLLPIGGVARIEVPDNPKQELAIAAAGPAVNVAIAAVLIAIGAVLQATSLVTPGNLVDSMRDARWSGLWAYLTAANIWLVAFNAIPAFPMDGGRILRALLALRMDYRRATQIAVGLGQGLALVFGLAGFATGDFFLIVIAAFVWLGAGAEGQQVAVRRVLGRVTVGDAMTRQPRVLTPSDPLSRAIEITLSTTQADFPVVDRDGRVVGLLTAEDLLRGLRDRPDATVDSVMRRDFPRVIPAETLVNAQQRLAEAGVRALPVVDQAGRLMGLLSLADVGEAFRFLSIRSDLATARSWASLEPGRAVKSQPPTTEPATADRQDRTGDASWQPVTPSDASAWAAGAQSGHGDGHAPQT